MPSSWSSSLRFELQFTGENINLWGAKLNTVLQHVDYSTAGWLTKALTADYALTSANAGDDEARAAVLKFTGTGPFTVTIPSVSKVYQVWNACSAVLTITAGAGATVTLKAAETCTVICDAINVYRVQPTEFGSQRLTGVADPVNPQEAATKNYVDGVAFSSAAGNLPGQTGNAGKFLKTDGTTAGWAPLKYQADATSHTLTLQASDGVTTLGSLKADTSGHLDLISAAGVNRIRSNTDGTVTTTSDAGTTNTLATVAQAVAFAIAL